MYPKSQVGTQELNMGLLDSCLKGLGINEYKPFLSKGEILYLVWTYKMMDLCIFKVVLTGFN